MALLRAALPTFMRDLAVNADAVEDPKLDLPPPLEADLVARAGTSHILHVEGQGYGERAFDERVFRYHLLLVLRHPERRIETVALWLVPPSKYERLGRIAHSGVQVDVHTVVLREVPASRLLDDPDALCFAAGADAEGCSDAELCDLVARRLRDQNAGWQRLLICAAVAGAAGRYDAMISAMQRAQLEPPIIEDLVQFGRERGIELGRTEGIARALLELLGARGLPCNDDQRALVEKEQSSARLLGWLRRAAVAATSDEVFRS